MISLQKQGGIEVINFYAYIEQFKQALQDEINCLRQSGGRCVDVNDGKYRGESEGNYVYSFATDSELFFPDDASIDLEVNRQKHQGRILTTGLYEVFIALQEFVGQSVSKAKLYVNPWFLLEALQQRLDEINAGGYPKTAFWRALLESPITALPPDEEKALELLFRIDSCGDLSTAINNEQLQAIGLVLNNKVSFVWGPPGTGKSTTLGLTGAALDEVGESILVVAHSNVAVDVAMSQLASNLKHAPTYLNGLALRVGMVSLNGIKQNFPLLSARGILGQQDPEFVRRIETLEQEIAKLMKDTRTLSTQELKQLEACKKELRPLLEQLKQRESELISKASIIGCTFSKATITPEIYERSFDAVLIDEASMAYIPHCAFVSSLAQKRVAVFGDFRQLAPIAQAKAPLVQQWLRRDVFDQAGIIEAVEKGQPEPRMAMLRTQYRMHPSIASIPNQLFYGNQLRTAAGVEARTETIVQRAPHPNESLVLFDLTQLSGECCRQPEARGSRFNLTSAVTAVKLAYRIHKANKNQTIGIITPYRTQARLIQRLLQDLQIPRSQVAASTVHRFQGSESDVIIFDTVDSPPLAPGKPLMADLESTKRLINVAITRARGKFMVLGYFEGYLSEKLGNENPVLQVLQQVRSACSTALQPDGELWAGEIAGLTYWNDDQQTREQLVQCIGNAKRDVRIYWPAGEAKPLLASLSNNNHRVCLYITGAGQLGFHAAPLKNVRYWENHLKHSMGVVGCDGEQILVYTKPHSEGGSLLRVELPETVKLLHSLFDLFPSGEGTRDLNDNTWLGEQCPNCHGSLGPDVYGRFETPCMICLGSERHARCGYRRRFYERDATMLARLAGFVCPKCEGQVVGRESAGDVFVACANYPECRWTGSVRNLL